MMKVWKCTLLFLLSIAVLLGSAACVSPPAAPEPAQTEEISEPATVPASAQPAHLEPATRIITDQAGREVIIPQKVERVATLFGVVTHAITALGKTDVLVGVGVLRRATIFEYTAPELYEVAMPFDGSGLDLEMLADLKPDVFFVRTRNTQDIESVTELGIPAIAVAPETSEEILRTMELIGEVIGAEEEAARLVELYKSMSDKAYEMTADVPYKPRAIVMGSAIGRVANMNMLQSHLIEAAGGLNMAKDIDTMELWPQAGVEMIFQWNPEYIFITNYGAREYSPEDIINDPAWQNIDAVKNKRVYLVGCDLDSWEFPAVSSVLGIYWMMSKMHPDIYSDEALEKEVAEFYKTVYGVDLTRQQLGY